VQTPDGCYLDIEGKRTGDEIRGRWGWDEITVDHADMDDWSLPWGWDGEEVYRERARQLVPELIAMASRYAMA